MKKVTIILLLIFISLFLTSCTQLEDIIPDITELSSWDGNYIYRGNLRCKTTGEDTETLISVVNYNNKIYIVQETLDYAYINDNIYMILQVEGKDDENITSFLVKYNLKTDQSNFIYRYSNINAPSEKLKEFIYTNNDYFYMVTDKDTKVYYNLLSNEEFIFNANRYYFFGEYIIIEERSKLMFSLIKKIDFKLIFETREGFDMKFVNKSYNEYLLIKTNVNKGIINVNRLLCYDFNQNILIELVSESENLKVASIGYDFYITGTEKEYPYVSNVKDGETLKNKILSKKLITNNKLYKIDYYNLDSELIYTFDENKEYIKSLEKDEKTLILKETRVIQGNQFFPGGSKTKTYSFNIDTKKFKKYKEKEEKQNFVEEESKIKVGEYEYYFVTQHYGVYLSSGEAYFFYSYNTRTKEEKLLQFFTTRHGNITEEVRCSQEIWEYGYGNIDLKDCLILNY